MRKKLILMLLALVAAGEARAADRDVLREIYTRIPEVYVRPISTETAAVNLLKGIPEVDKQLRIGDDDTRMSLYYKGRLLKSLYKPQNKNDVDKWVELSAELLDEAADKSPKAAKHDFEMVDLMMKSAIKQYDGDSKFYLNPDAMKNKRQKHQRNFAERIEDKDKLYIKIGAFNNFTKEDVENAVKEHPEAKGLILDLRGSPGGLLSGAVEIADLFLDNAIVASARSRNDVIFYNAEDGDILEGKPIVVLVDGKTASAAEVLAAALQEQSRAKIVGTNSFGKGSIQSLISLSSGATISLTSAYFYTPSEIKLDKKGVLSNYCTFEMPDAKNVENLLALGEYRVCDREERAGNGLDIAVAAALIDAQAAEVPENQEIAVSEAQNL